MKKFLFFILLLLVPFTIKAVDISGVYIKIVPEPGESLYLILEYDAKGILGGYYYGITDDFDKAREGYYPGYFVAKISQVNVNDNNISFVVHVNSDNCFTKPVPLSIRTSSEASKILKPWDVISNRNFDIPFCGTLKNGGISFKCKTKYQEKFFVKLTDSKILKTVAKARQKK